MHIISKLLIGLVALLHSYFLVLEMFLWESRGPKIFGNIPPDLFAPTNIMAANQGLYNGFLAAGLIWALVFVTNPEWKKKIALFFLSCVVIAGVYGGVTVSSRIMLVQALPAFLGVLSVIFLTKKA